MRNSRKQLVVSVIVSVVALVVLVLPATIVGAASKSSPNSPATVPSYDHVFVVVEENHGFQDVIGNPAAPNLNALAKQFGLATQYFGVSHPSEPNYVALLGGSTFGVADDNAYYVNRINQPSLISELDHAGISWKAYLQGLPHPGFEGICYPSRCNGAPDNDPLYVSKHDAIQNFSTSLNPFDWSRQVPATQLSQDLARNAVPRFGYVIPDECHDMHGDPPYCIDGGNPFDPQDQHLVTIGDQVLGRTVSAITSAPFWAKGNNAVVIAFDEGDDNAGCCGSPSPNGGGQVPTVVVTSHGPRSLQDATPYNHFSLLQTIQSSFGLPCLQNTCDTTDVTPMAPLFAVTGTSPIATSVLPEPNFPPPTPTPSEPVSSTTLTPSSGGWHVVRAPLLGTNDNSLGAVSGSAANNVWAVGNFLPDTDSSNQDATLSLAMHFDGTTWTDTPTPNVGPNFNTLFGVATSGQEAWAVGVALDSQFRDRALIEHWNGTAWSVVSAPQPGVRRDLLYSASAVSPDNVWAVGDQEAPGGPFETLAEHWDGHTWSVVPTPDPGSAGNHLYGVSAVGPNDVWAVGQRLDGNGDSALIEHWDGRRWSVTPTPPLGTASAMLDAVAATPSGVWAVGKTEDAATGALPLVEIDLNGQWIHATLPPDGSAWTDLWGVTAANGVATAVGTFVDAAGNNQTLILRSHANNWSLVNGPNPGSGGHILGGAAVTGNTRWAVGLYDDGGSNLPLIERSP